MIRIGFVGLGRRSLPIAHSVETDDVGPTSHAAGAEAGLRA